MEEYGRVGSESTSSSDDRSDESDTQDEELDRRLPGYWREHELKLVCCAMVVFAEFAVEANKSTICQNIRGYVFPVQFRLLWGI